MGWQELDGGSGQLVQRGVNSGDKARIDLAVKALKADFDKNNGVRPKLVTPSAKTVPNGGTFGSIQELMAAQNDPRYKSDPAYRNAVIEKLSRSSI